jgi:hypothetical protein
VSIEEGPMGMSPTEMIEKIGRLTEEVNGLVDINKNLKIVLANHKAKIQEMESARAVTTEIYESVIEKMIDRINR